MDSVQFFATPWTVAHQPSLSITSSQSLLKFMSIESVMPSSPLILCHPLVLPPSIFPSIKVFFKESVLRMRWPKYWSDSENLSTQDRCFLSTCQSKCSSPTSPFFPRLSLGMDLNGWEDAELLTQVV